MLPLRLPPQAIFAVVVAVTALAETMMATGLSAWLLVSVGPSLNHCSREPASISQCKCSTGFVDPPSLVRHVQFYEAVVDCGGLGSRLQTLYYLLTALYCVGVVLSATTLATAGKQLHSLGLCGKSGIYTVSSTVAPASHALTSTPPSPRSPPSLPPPSHASHPSPPLIPPSMPPTASSRPWVTPPTPHLHSITDSIITHLPIPRPHSSTVCTLTPPTLTPHTPSSDGSIATTHLNP